MLKEAVSPTSWCADLWRRSAGKSPRCTIQRLPVPNARLGAQEAEKTHKNEVQGNHVIQGPGQEEDHDAGDQGYQRGKGLQANHDHRTPLARPFFVPCTRFVGAEWHRPVQVLPSSRSCHWLRVRAAWPGPRRRLEIACGGAPLLPEYGGRWLLDCPHPLWMVSALFFPASWV